MCGGVDDALGEFHGVQSANGVFGGDVAHAIPAAPGIARGAHKLKTHAVVIAQLEHVLVGRVCAARALDAQ